jgi:PAS domain S-box-containing protein
MRLPFTLRSLDLKARIAIFTVVLFIGAIWLLAHDLDKDVRDNFQEVLAAQQFYNVEQVAGSLDEAVKLRINALTDAAALIKPEWMAHADRLHGFLAERTPLYRFFDTGIFVISREGIGLADLPDLEGREGTSYTERDFFSGATATGKPVVGKPILGFFSKKPVINIGVPIKNSSNEVIGVLVGGNQVSGSDLLSEIIPKKAGLNGDVHVISPRDGIYVTSTNHGLILQAEPLPGVIRMYDRYRQGYEGSGVSVNSKGIENLSSGKRVPSTGWLVIATLPTSIAFEPIAVLQREIYQDAGLAALVVVLLLWLFLYRQLSPLSRSAQIVDEMASGRAPLRPLPLEGSEEIRRLLGSFNQLQQHIGEQAQSLRESAEQMRLAASVFEGTGEAILISSADNRIISVNRAFCRMTGYAESELIGGNPRLLQSGRHDHAYYQQMWSSLLNTGQWRGEIWNRRKSGEIYPEWLTISVLYDEEGKVLRYIAIAADITERKTTEMALRLLSTGMARLSGAAFFNEMARRMAEYLHAEIGFVGRLQALTKPRCRTLGLCIDGQVMPAAEYDLAQTPCETVIGKKPVVFPDHVQQLFPAAQVLLDLGVSGYAAVPLFDRHGNPMGHVGIMSRAPLCQTPEEIESLLQLFAVRAAAEIERERAEGKFRDLFERSPEASVIANQAGLITAVNRAAESLFGYAQEELVGVAVESLVPETWRQKHVAQRQSFHSKPWSRPMGLNRGNLQARKKDGTTFPVEISLNSLDSDDGPLVVATVRDISERERAESERRALESQLRQSQKMEAIGTLAGGIAHDFNNIIGAILGNAELARQDVGEGHLALESIAEINKAARRARDLVQQILAFSRKQILTRKVIALGPVVEEAVKLLQAILPAGVRLTAVCAADTPNVFADHTQIYQVLMNLCTNAWHAMEGRTGHIDLRLEEVVVDGKSAGEHSDLRTGRYARLSVRDSGRGMDAATQGRIFEPFFTTKPVGEGTGLGLSVVHGIMQEHEGAITMSSAPGKGTTFNLYLPAVDAVTAEDRQKGVVGEFQRGQGQHVLYLDDDDALVLLVTRMLERLGYRVSGYVSATEALEAVRADPGQFDLVVTDYNMPGMSGLDVADELARIRPDLPVAVTSGYISDELRRKMPESNVRHLIYKSNTVEEFCAAVHKLTCEARS